ncbi:MAG TPA: hypothetical protein VFN19_08660, partial [Candidatus Nanopelagicales bacterium]|nr:hypothetical protein [Candidatus Nanopelagicales bacterium]
MFSRRRHRSRPGSAAAIGGVLSLALATPLLTPPATAAVGGEVAAVGTLAARGSGVLSGRLVELARPAVAAASDHTRAQALSLPVQGPGALLTDAADRVLVELQLTDTAPATVAALARIGEIVNVNPAAGRATVRIRPDRLEELDSVGAVRYADLVPAPISGSSLPRTAATVGAAGSSRSRCRALSSEADTQLHARKARKAYGEDGSGVTVGVLSDSYDTADAATDARADIASGDLPGPGNPCGRLTPVDVVADYHPNPNDPGDTVTDEGRAMLQGIHDLAPGAGLAFATANDGPDAFAANIRRLARTGASVIVDDITYLTEPFFQSGVIDKAVHKVTDKYGVTYLSSAGNTNVDLAGRSVASWEDPKTSLTDCPALTLDPHQYGPLTSCVSFGTTLPDSGYQLRIAPGGSVLPVVQWAEPIGGVSDDFDVFLVDATTNKVLAGSAGDQARSQTPVEYFGWRNDSATTRNVKIVIPRYSGTGTPRLKISFVTLQGLVSMEYDRSAGGN